MRLSIDLSHKIGTVALHQNGALIDTFTLEGENRPSELLIDSFSAFFKKNQIEKSSIKEIVTSLGPGSFTGMRIAVSTVKALAIAWKIPMYLVSGSEARARAYQKRYPNNKKDIVVLTRVAAKSFAKADLISNQFKEDVSIEMTDLASISNSIILADAKETLENLKGGALLFPSSAEYLGEQLEFCTSKISCSSFEEIVKASPVYYGSTRFG